MRGEGLCSLNDHYPTNVRLCWGPHGAWFRANSFALQPFSNRFGRRSGALSINRPTLNDLPRNAGAAHAPIDAFAPAEIYRVVAACAGAEAGDREAGRLP